MKKNLVKNFLYQASYQITLMILPIITIPIVSHSLGVDGIGIYNYVTSIVSYFILVAGLGLANYGIREIATVKNDKDKLSEKFWSLELFNIIIVFFVIILYLIFLFFLEEKKYFLIAGISVLATLFDISWFYYGIEDFKEITIINIFVKIVSFILIVFLINNRNDIWKYCLIQYGSILISNISLWIFLKNKIHWVCPSLKSSMYHLKPALGYFIGKASITIYTTLNKTLLGILATTTAVGLYTNSLQLITMFITLIGTLDTVLMPHLTGIYTDKDSKQMVNVIEKTINFQLFFSIPLMFGLILTNTKLIPWFFGSDFSYLTYTVPVLSPLVIIIPLGTSIVRQYLIPMNNIKKFNISVIVAAVIGLVINLIFIPLVGIWGAIIAIIVSELVVTSIRLHDLLKNSDFKFKYVNISLYFLASFIMYFIVKNISSSWKPNIMTTITQGILGFTIYFTCIILFKKNVFVMYLKKYKNRKEENQK